MRVLVVLSLLAAAILSSCCSDKIEPPKKPYFSKDDLSTDVLIACERFKNRAPHEKRFSDVSMIKGVFPKPTKETKKAWRNGQYDRVVPDQIMTVEQLYSLIGEPSRTKREGKAIKRIYDLGHEDDLIRELWVYTVNDHVINHVYTAYGVRGN